LHFPLCGMITSPQLSMQCNNFASHKMC